MDSTAATPRASRWEDYVDILFSPAELFDRRRDDRWLPPAIVLVIASIALYYVFLPANRLIMETGMSAQAANPDAAEAAERMGGTIAMLGGLVLLVTLPALLALRSVLLWLVGRTFEVALRPGQAAIIAVYAAFVGLLQQAATASVILLRPETFSLPASISFGPLRFLDADAMAPALVPLLGRLDLFLLWQAALWATGLVVIARASRTQAILAAAVVWLLGAVPGVVTAVITGRPPM